MVTPKAFPLEFHASGDVTPGGTERLRGNLKSQSGKVEFGTADLASSNTVCRLGERKLH